jgi:acyl-coenzyme A synthetase/AMP-(fatty) acid ligase
MNTAALVNPCHFDEPVAEGNGQPITYRRFLSEVAALADHLPDKPTVINLAADRYRFLVGFAAALVRRQTTLLPSNQAPHALAQLAREYGNSYCLAEAHETVDGLPFCRIPQDESSTVYDLKVPRIPIAHTAVVAFTSGSTGKPKAHPKSWGSLVAVARTLGDRLGLPTCPSMTIVGTVPHHHMYGLEATIMLPIQHGMAFHVGRPLFPEDVRAALAEVPSPRMLVTTPLHIKTCALASIQLPHLNGILSATAPLPAALAQQAETCFKTHVYEVYGFTEAGSIATRRTVAGDTWHVLDGITMYQESDRCSVRAAYFPEPVSCPDLISPQGARQFVLHGRGEDQVNIGGHRVSLGDLNQTLNAIEGVEDGVFVFPDQSGPSVTRLVAFAVAPGKSVEQIQSALRNVIDPVFLPRPLHVVANLPRNGSGKLTRETLISLARTLDGHGGHGL